MRVFLDSVLVIYLVDQNPVFAPRVEASLNSNPCDIISSELVRLESLVLPVRMNDIKRIADYENFLAVSVAEMVTLSRAVFDQAIQIRASLKAIKAPDALHLAAAVESGCDVFATNDPQLKQFPGIRVEVI